MCPTFWPSLIRTMPRRKPFDPDQATAPCSPCRCFKEERPSAPSASAARTSAPSRTSRSACSRPLPTRPSSRSRIRGCSKTSRPATERSPKRSSGRRRPARCFRSSAARRPSCRPCSTQFAGAPYACAMALNGDVYQFDGELIHFSAHANFTQEALEVTRRTVPRATKPRQRRGTGDLRWRCRPHSRCHEGSRLPQSAMGEHDRRAQHACRAHGARRPSHRRDRGQQNRAHAVLRNSDRAAEDVCPAGRDSDRECTAVRGTRATATRRLPKRWSSRRPPARSCASSARSPTERDPCSRRSCRARRGFAAPSSPSCIDTMATGYCRRPSQPHRQELDVVLQVFPRPAQRDYAAGGPS